MTLSHFSLAQEQLQLQHDRPGVRLLPDVCRMQRWPLQSSGQDRRLGTAMVRGVRPPEWRPCVN